MNDSINNDVSILLAGYVLVLLYVVLVLGRRNLVELKVSPPPAYFSHILKQQPAVYSLCFSFRLGWPLLV